jgi:hypothetical protein
MAIQSLTSKSLSQNYGTFNKVEDIVKPQKSEIVVTTNKSHFLYLVLGYSLVTVGSPVLGLALLFVFFSCLTQDLCFEQDNFGAR